MTFQYQIQVHILAAKGLKDKNVFGSIQPKVRIGFDYNHCTISTPAVSLNSDKIALYNQPFTLIATGAELYVEVVDDNNIIGFCAVPMDQAYREGVRGWCAWVPIYGVKGGVNGHVHLLVTPPNGLQGTGVPNDVPNPYAYINEKHKIKVKSSKEQNGSFAKMFLGCATGVGCAMCLSAICCRGTEEAEPEIALHESSQSQAPFIPTAVADYSSAGGESWDPVGSYSTGDKVVFHGQEWICLQSHVSNPTWEPGAATSLWKRI